MEMDVGAFPKLPKWLLSYANPMSATLLVGTFYGSLRPIAEFVLPTNFSKPTSAEALQRLKYNGSYFWANYCALCGVIIVISIFTNPTLLLVMGMFAFLWWKVFDDECTLFD